MTWLRSDWVARFLIAAGFFAAVAPTLRWLEFYHAEENVVVATAMETRRSGNWLVPTLQNKPRTIKPPLTLWMTALAIRPQTLRQLDHPDPAVRAEAYRDLAFEARWPTLLLASLMLIAVFDLGKALGDRALGVASAAICGTTWYFMIRQGPKATVDLQLALWVCAANAFFARALLLRKTSLDTIFAGVALGLAIMSKGPAVALLQTIVPIVILLLWQRGLTRARMKTILSATAIALVVGLWWYALVAMRMPDITRVWWNELTRHGANDLPPDPWHHYFRAMRFFFPWLIWLIAGIVLAIKLVLDKKRDDPRLLAFFLAAIPFLVMSLFEERKERYLIPLIGPASVVAAWALQEFRRSPLAIVHWAGLIILALALPIAGALGAERMRTTQGNPWFSWPLAITSSVVMTGIIVAAIFKNRLIFGTVLVMIIAAAIYQFGFSRDEAGRSDMRPLAEEIRTRFPDAELHSWYGPEKPGIVFMPGVDLAIYTNKTVARLADPRDVKPGARPQTILAVSKNKDPLPAPPPSWKEFARRERHNEIWTLYSLTP